MDQSGIDVRLHGDNTFHGMQILANRHLRAAYESTSRSAIYKLKNGEAMIIKIC